MMTETPIAEKTIHFMSEITHPEKIQQDKIKYFEDCLNLFADNEGFPLCEVKLNTRLLCRALNQLLNSDSNFKYKYAYHYFYFYKNLLLPTSFLNTNYKDLLVVVNKEFEEVKNWGRSVVYASTNLKTVLEKVINELDKTYFDNAVEQLKIAVFCPDDLFKHNHIKIIEDCAKVIMVEFYSIGYSHQSIKKIFNDAIRVTHENFESLGRVEVLKIPVPDEIYNRQKEIDFPEYKELVRLYLNKKDLKNQFDNLKYIHRHSQRPRTFIFKIKRLQLETEEAFNYDGIIFSSSLKEKYVKEDNNEKYKSFYESETDTTFCEVTVVSGNEDSALQEAFTKAQSSLSYIKYHVEFRARDLFSTPYVDLSGYVSLDVSPTITQRNLTIRNHKNDLVNFEYFRDIEKLRSHETVQKYLKLDKIFFESLNAENDFNANSQLWRYCESLFTDGKDTDKIIKTLVNYYCTKVADFHIYLGLRQMIGNFVGSYYYGSRDKLTALGITFEELRVMDGKDQDIEDYISGFTNLIKHPIINNQNKKIAKLDTEAKKFDESFKHYYKILKSANIQRNIFQHSDITIEELKNIWHDEIYSFVGTLRKFIIKDLTNNPSINSIEELFPPITKSAEIDKLIY